MKRLRLRHVLVPVVIVVVAVTASGIVLAIRGEIAHRAQASEAALPAWAHALALRTAKGMGEPHPSGEWALTTDDAVVQVFGQTAAWNHSNWGAYATLPRFTQYLFILHGHFVDKHAIVPPDVAVHARTILELVIDSEAGMVVDTRVTNLTPDTSAVDPMTIFTP